MDGGRNGGVLRGEDELEWELDGGMGKQPKRGDELEWPVDGGMEGSEGGGGGWWME